MSIWSRLSEVVREGTTSLLDALGTLGALVLGGESETGSAPEDSRYLPTRGQQIAFTIGVIGLGAKMAKADGRVTQDEVMAFHEVFFIPPEEHKNFLRVFNLARQDVAGFESYARQVYRLFRGRPGVLEDLLDGLFHIAKADGEVHPSEVTFLQRVAEIFGFAPGEFERIRCSHVGCPNADPHSILGVEPDISDEDLKRAYRNLVRQNHPDAMIARGVPEEFVEIANQKLAIINDAYETLRKARGL